MKCLNKYQHKGMQVVYSHNISMLIMVSVFLLASLIMLSMAPVAIAQSQVQPQSPLTLQEERIINMHKRMVLYNRPPKELVDAFSQEIAHYMRDGCKEALAGDWRWDPWNDVITITYNEQYKVFLGKVTRPVRMDYEPEYLLFKVYFPTDQLRSYILNNMNMTPARSNDWLTQFWGRYLINDNIDVEWLRQKKQCRGWVFIGKEYSFNQITKKKTEMELWLILNGDRIEYKLEKKSWYLNRTIYKRSPTRLSY